MIDRKALAGVGLLRLIDTADRRTAVRVALMNLSNNDVTGAGVAQLLRSPHRGDLDEVELWSASLERSHAWLREFFAGDPRFR